MNSVQRKALMLKRRRMRRIRAVIILSFFILILCIGTAALIIFITNKKDSPPAVSTPAEMELVVDKEPVRYYNTNFQPVQLSIEEYFNKETAAVSPIELIDDNASAVDIAAEYAVVIDAVSMTVVYNKNGNKKCYPASTTKILTALVALENCPAEYIIEAGNEIDMIQDGSSIAYLQKGHRLTLKMLIDGLMLPSGNDAAYTIAVNVARYINPNPELTDEMCVTLFAKLMTDKAKAIGATDSNFTVPDGYYDENHYTTAYDMALITNEAIKNPIISKAASSDTARNIFISGEDVTWHNTNMLIRRGGPYYYQYATGIKTGTNDESGYCLLSSAEKDGKKLIAVIMSSTPAGRWDDSVRLFEHFFGE